MTVETTVRRPRFGYWLLASVPLALFLDVWIAGFGRFAYCGIGYCRNAPPDLVIPSICVAVAGFLVFLAVALPPWISGWRRPVIAAAAGVVVAVAAGCYAFQPI